jgi:hypothetical protein
MGRPMPGPGEPLFTEDDTAAVIALAEEERDTCPSCGLLKIWCRGAGSQFTDYEVAEETCQATMRLAQFRESDGWKAKHAATQKATQLSVRFREGHEPDVDAGLDLPEHEHPGNDSEDR